MQPTQAEKQEAVKRETEEEGAKPAAAPAPAAAAPAPAFPMGRVTTAEGVAAAAGASGPVGAAKESKLFPAPAKKLTEGTGTYLEHDAGVRPSLWLGTLLEDAANGKLTMSSTKQRFGALDRKKVFDEVRNQLHEIGFLQKIVEVLGKTAVLADAALPVVQTTEGERHRDHELGVGKLLKVILSTSDQGVGTVFSPTWEEVRSRALLFDAYMEHASPARSPPRQDRVVLTFAALDDDDSCQAAHVGVVSAPKLKARQEHIFAVHAIAAAERQRERIAEEKKMVRSIGAAPVTLGPAATVKLEPGTVKLELKLQPPPADRQALDIPLVGPGEYGVWQYQLDPAEGVEELREHLREHWSLTDGKLRVDGDTSDIHGYSGYKTTAAKYDASAQWANTLRWGHSKAREAGLRKYLPGFDKIEKAVRQVVLSDAFPDLVPSLGLYNGHILRQFYQADGGSGFGMHIDLADDAWKKIRLFVSVAVLLTDEPEGADGTWMRVHGFSPVRYGRKAGSVVMFVSRMAHMSLRTPENMGHVLKLVLFYYFEGEAMQAHFHGVTPEDPLQGVPNVVAALPLQVINLCAGDAVPPSQPSGDVPPNHPAAPSLQSEEPKQERVALKVGECLGFVAWLNVLKRASNLAWAAVATTLSRAYSPGGREAQPVRLRLTASTAGFDEDPYFGIIASVRADSSALVPTKEEVVKMLNLKAKHVEGMTGVKLRVFDPPLLYQKSRSEGVNLIVSPMVYVSSEVSVNLPNSYFGMKRGDMLSSLEVFFGAVQFVVDDDALVASAGRNKRTIYDFYPPLSRGSGDKLPVWVVAWSPDASGIHLFKGVRSQDAPWPSPPHVCTHSLYPPLAAGPDPYSPVRHE